MSRTATAFCLLGRSGTGKSVTLKHIVGLLRPDRGRVFVHGEDVAALTGRELSEVRKRDGISVSERRAVRLDDASAKTSPFRCGATPTGPTRRFARSRAQRLADVGLERDYDKMPADLSGGMQKRAGLARAMVLDPDILLVDEPSAGLDPITAREIDELLVDLKKKGGDHARRRDAQHPERPLHRRRARDAARRPPDCARERGRTRSKRRRDGARVHAIRRFRLGAVKVGREQK